MLKARNKMVSLIFVLVSIFYIILAARLPRYPYIPVDSDVVPIGLGIVLMGLSIALYFMKDEESNAEREANKHSGKEWGVVLAVFLFVLLYIAFLNVLGFFLVTLLFLFFCTWFLGYKHFLSNAIVSIVVSSGIYLLFTQFLQIKLPQGILPF